MSNSIFFQLSIHILFRLKSQCTVVLVDFYKNLFCLKESGGKYLKENRENIYQQQVFIYDPIGNGLECDTVIHLSYGDYAFVKIKLGGEKLINVGISNLKSIEGKILEYNQKLLSFKMIVTASGDARIKDGVYIFPINTLKA